MRWLRWYRDRCRATFAAAWIYLRDGDERAFDLRLARLDGSLFVRLGNSIALCAHVAAVGLQGLLRASVKAAAEFQEMQLRLNRKLER